MPVRGTAHCQTSRGKVLERGRFTRLAHEAEFRGEKKASSCVVVAGKLVLEQSEFPPLFGQRKPRSSIGVARPVSRGKEGFG